MIPTFSRRSRSMSAKAAAAPRSRGGWPVQNQQPHVACSSFGDLDHLLVRCAREIADGFARIEIETKLGKQAFGTPTHLGDAQKSQALGSRVLQ